MTWIWQGVEQAIAKLTPDLVVNLVESLGGRGRLISAVPFLLEALGMPFTGAPALAMHESSHKVLAKTKMHAAGLSTSAWIGRFPVKAVRPMGCRHCRMTVNGSSNPHGNTRLWGSVRTGCLRGRFRRTPATASAAGRRSGGSCFAEQFIDGRRV
ncbi:MAG: hypothetical protein R2860_14085 [Desulfobacterales bacterium]